MASSQDLHLVHSPARTVVILGPSAAGDILSITASVAGRAGELLVLATGWPPTSAQHDAIHDAMRAAADRRIPFEARLLYTEDEIEDHLLPGDSVVVPGMVEALDERPVPSLA
jgi:hypothetical protein